MFKVLCWLYALSFLSSTENPGVSCLQKRVLEKELSRCMIKSVVNKRDFCWKTSHLQSSVLQLPCNTIFWQLRTKCISDNCACKIWAYRLQSDSKIGMLKIHPEATPESSKCEVFQRCIWCAHNYSFLSADFKALYPYRWTVLTFTNHQNQSWAA